MQLILIDMMSDLDKLLKENNITYTLLGGSVLGAVRHKGFIPWDDDMDIGILREDFERAEKLLLDFKPYAYESAWRHVLPGGPLGKFRLINEEYPMENCPTIDIFPLDKLPCDKNKWKKFGVTINIYHAFMSRHPPRHRGKKNKIIFTIFYKVVPPKILDYFQKVYYKKITAYNDTESDYIGNFYGAWTTKEYFPKEIYTELIEADFENLKLPIPKNYDAYLTQLYGDYMTPPDEKDRQPRHREFE